ncbi:Uncharacterised protein [Mycobacteroides abscessus subsp. abscessus]|nr:Uncharacterised protein [Mycobacteroides abscessus subsp. abscessus]
MACRSGQTVGGVLRERENASRANVGVVVGQRRRCGSSDRLLRSLHLGGRRGENLCGIVGGRLSGRRGRRCVAAACLCVGELTLELFDTLFEVAVLLDQTSELCFDKVKELIDFVLVVAALTDRRFAERDVVHISWCQPHVGSPHCR